MHGRHASDDMTSTFDNVQQRDDVGASLQVLQDLDLPLDLFILNGLENLDDAAGLIWHVYALEHLAVFAPANLANNLVVVLVTPRDPSIFIVPE